MRARDRASAGAGVIALLACVLLMGGGVRWAQAVIALFVLAAVVPAVTSRRMFQRTSPLVAMIGAATALTALQLVPLPSALVSWLAPLSALREDGLQLIGASSWNCLSLDPAGTALSLAYFIILLGAAFVSLRFAASERGRFGLVSAVAATCGLAAAVGALHELLGLRVLYGLYEPVHATPVFFGPLLNPNHFGSLLGVGAILSVGLVLHDKQSATRRAAWFVNGAGCVIGCLATLSRGAVLAMLIGVGVTLATVVAQKVAVKTAKPRRIRSRLLTNTLPIGIVVTCVLFVVIYTNADRMVSQLETTSLDEITEPRSKYAAWRSAMILVEESPWVGVGRGALESSLTRVHPASAFVTFSHLENEYVQAVVEFGIPGVLVIAAALSWLLLVASRRWREGSIAAGALGALAMALVHNSVDFGAQLLGLAVPLTVIAAVLTHVPLREPAGRTGMRPRSLRIGLALLLAAGSALSFSSCTRTISEDHALVANGGTDEDLRDAVSRHPLDYYAYAVAAEQRIRRDPATAIRFLNHALTLHPTHVDLHRLAARLLFRAGLNSQAALEYGLALRGTRTPGPLVKEIVATFPPSQAAETIPLDYMNLDAITKAAPPKVSIDWLALVLEKRPQDLRAADALFKLALEHGDLERAEVAARRRVELVPSIPMRLGYARVLSKRKRWKELTDSFADVATWRGHGRKDEIAEAWLLLCAAHTALDETAEALRCLHLLDGSDVPSARERTEVKRRLQQLQQLRESRPL